MPSGQDQPDPSLSKHDKLTNYTKKEASLSRAHMTPLASGASAAPSQALAHFGQEIAVRDIEEASLSRAHMTPLASGASAASRRLLPTLGKK